MVIPKLGYWDIRGNTEAIRLVLHHAGVEFNDKRYQYGPGPDHSRQAWLDDKNKLGLAFPNLPYYIEGDLKLTQSAAILRHVARKNNLVGKSLEDQAILDMLEQQVIDFRVGLTSICYNPDFENLREPYLATLSDKIKQFANFLGENQYVAGDYLTYVDFLLYDALQIHTLFEPTALNGFANLKHFIERIEALPNVAKYHKSAEYHPLPYNGITAKWGNRRA